MLQLVRRMRRDRATYYGPYSSAASIRQTLSLLNCTLGLRVCKDRELRERTRACPLHEMGYCTAPCIDAVTPEEYGELVRQAQRFLAGETGDLVARIRTEMEAAAGALDFERAAELRDRITAIERTVERQKMVSPSGTDRDVVGIHRVDASATVEVLYIRDGALAAESSFHLGSAPQLDADLLDEFLRRFYASDRFVPREIHVAVEPTESGSLLEWLADRRGAPVKLHQPQRGTGRRLLELAERNAEQAALSHRIRARAEDDALAEVAARLGLPEAPRRIDCFDIANLQGTATVGAMSVLVDGLPAPTLYRHYRIRSLGTGQQDDFRAMAEVVARRYRDAAREGSLPDLVLIDGGHGQLGRAAEAMRQLGLGNVPVASIAKERGRGGGDRIYQPDQPERLDFPVGSRGLLVLQRARDEAHRFAGRYHEHLRDRAGTRTGLEDVPGVGPRTITRLTRHFASLSEMRAASLEEIAAIDGITQPQARAIHSALHPDSAPDHPTP
jgi:excinuclease ABC subunit C